MSAATSVPTPDEQTDAPSDDLPASLIWQIPALDEESRLATGVAAGIARELGVQPIVIRASFAILTVAGGWGVILYGAAWLAMTLWPGTNEPTPKGATDLHRNAGVGLVVLGLLLLFRTFSAGFIDVLVWPAGFVFAGALIAWSEVRDSDRGGQRGAVTVARLGAGLIVAIGGVLAVTALSLDTRDGALALLLTVAVMVGVAVVASPSLIRVASALDTERNERVRSEEKARVAAHLHDSVLQTLTLIQRHADDPQVTAQLARRQERELRTWLYAPATPPGSVRLSEVLHRITDQIETDHGVPVQVVVVGDDAIQLDADDRLEALAGAAREAVTNAAKHAGANRIDLFCELSNGTAEVFVRDTGCGFDPKAVANDRKGLSESIVGRIERNGGTVSVHSAPGEGTEIELRMPLTLTDADEESSDSTVAAPLQGT